MLFLDKKEKFREPVLILLAKMLNEIILIAFEGCEYIIILPYFFINASIETLKFSLKIILN